MQINWL